jgi:hypothetical protein
MSNNRKSQNPVRKTKLIVDRKVKLCQSRKLAPDLYHKNWQAKKTTITGILNFARKFIME